MTRRLTFSDIRFIAKRSHETESNYKQPFSLLFLFSFRFFLSFLFIVLSFSCRPTYSNFATIPKAPFSVYAWGY